LCYFHIQSFLRFIPAQFLQYKFQWQLRIVEEVLQGDGLVFFFSEAFAHASHDIPGGAVFDLQYCFYMVGIDDPVVAIIAHGKCFLKMINWLYSAWDGHPGSFEQEKLRTGMRWLATGYVVDGNCYIPVVQRVLYVLREYETIAVMK
jgi:hypothetical protein